MESVVVSEEEEEEEDESITRCICSKQHSIGLMVCCDDCEAWQHCECMGLEEEEIPDQYFCEKCRPSYHTEIKGYDKYYKPFKPENKKILKKGPVETIIFEKVLEFHTEENLQNKSNRSKRSAKFEKKSSLTGSTNTRKSTNPSRRPNKIPRAPTYSPQPEMPTPPTSTSSILFEHLSPLAREASPPVKARTPSARMTISEMNKRVNHILEYICSLQEDVSLAKKRKNDDSVFDEVCKKQKLIEYQTKEKYYDSGRPTPILIPGQSDRESPSSSLSSASTIPLEEDHLFNSEKSIAEEALEMLSKPDDEQSSTQIIDMLTRKSMVFQRRFGRFSYGGLNADEPGSKDNERSLIIRDKDFYQDKKTLLTQ